MYAESSDGLSAADAPAFGDVPTITPEVVLPACLQELLQHVQGHLSPLAPESVIQSTLRLLHCITPRVTLCCDVVSGGLRVQRPQVSHLDLGAVRSLCSDGVPDEAPALRAVVWKLVLGLLPANVDEWDQALKEARVAYSAFVEDLKDWVTETDCIGCTGPSLTNTLEQISLDAIRTRPELDFFSRPLAPIVSKREASLQVGEALLLAPQQDPLQAISRNTVGSSSLDSVEPSGCSAMPEANANNAESLAAGTAGDSGVSTSQGSWGPSSVSSRDVRHISPSASVDALHPRRHYDVLARILLVFARLNPGLLYVQGMNELCAPLYYLFAQDPLNIEFVEADTFACFSLLMAERRDSFTKSLDDADCGLLGLTRQINELLRRQDESVWQHLEVLEVKPVYYAVRWVTLMLTQELEMPDVLRVWDSLLSDGWSSPPMLHCVCVAMIIHARDALLAGDFEVCAGVLQQGSAGGSAGQPVVETLRLAKRLQAADAANTTLGKSLESKHDQGELLARGGVGQWRSGKSFLRALGRTARRASGSSCGTASLNDR